MLFNEAACFSKRVPKETIQTWLAHGGRIHSGGSGSVASYFFSVSREDEWTSILCRRSIVAIHVGWILHCVAHSFRVPIVEYILDDGFDDGPPFSRMGTQDPMLAPVDSPRYPQQVSRSFASQSRPQAPFFTTTNVLQKRKRQRDNLAYPNALQSESGDSLPRRPRKRQMLSLKPSSSSAESLPDIAITGAHDFAVAKHNDNVRSTHVVTPDICFANTTSDNLTPSAPRYLTLPFEAMSTHRSQGSSSHCSPKNDQGHENAVDPKCAYECAPGYTLIANGTRPIACLQDSPHVPANSPPVPAIDFTRMQFSSRNRWRFPLMRLEPVVATAKAESREDSEDPTSSAASDHTPIRMFAQDMSSATQPPGDPAVPEAGSSGNYEDTETTLPVIRQGNRVTSYSSLRRLGDAIDSRNDTAIYHMDQLIRTSKRATGRDDPQFATLWENNAMWKGMRFWHENLKKPTWSADNNGVA